jgi:Zn-finger nucleic acid-binding protein
VTFNCFRQLTQVTRIENPQKIPISEALQNSFRTNKEMAQMKCPVDDTILVMSDRNGVEIDYCPTCRGVWLDRGELDKIIERSAPPAAPQASAPRYEEPHYGEKPYRKKRKESFLSDIFDF